MSGHDKHPQPAAGLPTEGAGPQQGQHDAARERGTAAGTGTMRRSSGTGSGSAWP